MSERTPWHAWLVLWRPRRVLANLRAVERAGIVARVPNLWQIQLGVLRMWYRILFRSEEIGTSATQPVRASRRARWLQYRGLRFPFLLWEGSVRPWDLSGLLSTPDSLTSHLLGTHHDGAAFVYDMQILALAPGRLEALRDRARAVVAHDDRRSRWLRDLCVYERYHEDLLATLERALARGFELAPEDADDPKVSFHAYLRWAARQPATPLETWRAWRRGEWSLPREADARA